MRRPRSRSVVVLWSVVAVLAMGSVACGDDGDEGTSATTTTEPDTGSGDEDAEANILTIEMKDYSYAISGALTAGASTVSMTNSGEEMHMASIARLVAGKTLADIQDALQSEDEAAFSSLFEDELGAPGGFLSPGQSQEITTDGLEEGSYAVICFLPTAGESLPHFAKGMVSTFDVAEGTADVTKPQPDAEFTIDDGQTDGPDELKAGETTFQVASAGDGPHEFFVMKKNQPGTTYDQVDQFFTNLFESETPPPVGYAAQAPAVIVASSFDIEAGASVSVTTDLEPGSYLIGCALEPDGEDGAQAKPHEGEILEVTVS